MAEETPVLATQPVAIATPQHAGELTAAEATAWFSLGDVLLWVEMPGPLGDAASTAGSFLRFIGAQATDHWRALSTIPEADFSAALTG